MWHFIFCHFFTICMFIVFTEDKVKKNSIYQNLTIHLHNINKLSYKNMIIFHIVLIWLGYNEHLMQTSVSLMSSVSKSMSNTPAILKQRRCSQTVCCVSIHFTYKHGNIFGSCGPSYTDSYGWKVDNCGFQICSNCVFTPDQKQRVTSHEYIRIWSSKCHPTANRTRSTRLTSMKCRMWKLHFAAKS